MATFTCSICGAENSKRGSRAIDGKGRVCRSHEKEIATYDKQTAIENRRPAITSRNELEYRRLANRVNEIINQVMLAVNKIDRTRDMYSLQYHADVLLMDILLAEADDTSNIYAVLVAKSIIHTRMNAGIDVGKVSWATVRRHHDILEATPVDDIVPHGCTRLVVRMETTMCETTKGGMYGIFRDHLISTAKHNPKQLQYTCTTLCIAYAAHQNPQNTRKAWFTQTYVDKYVACNRTRIDRICELATAGTLTGDDIFK